MDFVSQFVKNMGVVKLSALGIAGLCVSAFLLYFANFSSTGDLGLLFGNIDPADGARIVEKLESLNVTYDIRGDGRQIYVPRDKVSRLRMEMAQEGLPNSGAVGYEIFDRQDVLGSFSTLMDINSVRALEGELSKSIQSIGNIAAARVHLVVPKRELFSRDKNQPSASVVLKMKGVARLLPQQVRAIQHLVASAVPDMDADKISVIDDKGNLLAKNQGSDSGALALNQSQEMKKSYEDNLSKTIESMLEKSLGVGKVRVEVNADMDFDRVVINSEEYNPEGQVIRSVTNIDDGSNSTESSGDQGVSVKNALPDASKGGATGKNSSQSKRKEENTTYEISKTIKSHTKESGNIKRLSVAVLVDGIYDEAKAGAKPNYKERPKAELDQITTLVKSAIGFKEDRGDAVQVVNMKFHNEAENLPLGPKDQKGFMDNLDLSKIIEMIVLGLVGFLILVLFLRPIIVKALERNPMEGELLQALPSDMRMQHQSLPGVMQQGAIQHGGAISEAEGVMEKGLIQSSSENTEGVIETSGKKIENYAESSPEETVAVLRSWIYQPK